MIPNQWDSSNIQLLESAIDSELVRKNVQIRAEKQTDILNHLERYVCNKTVNFSTLPPSDELAEVMAAQIVRAIEWANNNPFPPQARRNQAKAQIYDCIDQIQAMVLNHLGGLQVDAFIINEFDKIRAKYEWRIDSHFYVHGKKVFNKRQLDQILNECQNLCNTVLDLKQI